MIIEGTVIVKEVRLKMASNKVRVMVIGLDAEAALDWCLKSDDVDNKKIFIFGRSLGGAVTIHL